ncbi:hypothetical protein PLESTF_000522700 [Pleodorina starrii]|nr:hypothetical protein PLESTF_000522700 [Pleodorina starrii]
MAGSELNKVLQSGAGFYNPPVVDQLVAQQRRGILAALIGVPAHVLAGHRRHLEGQHNRHARLRRAREVTRYRPHLRAAATSAITSASRDEPPLREDVCTMYLAEINAWDKIEKLKALNQHIQFKVEQARERSAQLQQQQLRRRQPATSSGASGSAAIAEGTGTGDAPVDERHVAAFRLRLDAALLQFDVYDMAAKLLAARAAAESGNVPASGSPPSAVDSVFLILNNQAPAKAQDRPAAATAAASSPRDDAAAAAATFAASIADWDAGLPNRALSLFEWLMEAVVEAGDPVDGSGAVDCGDGVRWMTTAARQRKLKDHAMVLVDALIRYCGGPALLVSELLGVAHLLYRIKSTFADEALKSYVASFAREGSHDYDRGRGRAAARAGPAAPAAPPGPSILTSAAVLSRLARRAALTSPPLFPLRYRRFLAWPADLLLMSGKEAAAPPMLVRLSMAPVGRALAQATARIRIQDGRNRLLTQLTAAAEEELAVRQRRMRALVAGSGSGGGGGGGGGGGASRSRHSRKQRQQRKGQQRQRDGDDGSESDGGGRGISNVSPQYQMYVESSHGLACRLVEVLPEVVQQVWAAATAGGRGSGGDEDEDEEDEGGGSGHLVLLRSGFADGLEVRRRLVKLLMDVECGRTRRMAVAGAEACAYSLVAIAALGRLGLATRFAMERIRDSDDGGGGGGAEVTELLEGRSGGAVSEPLLLGPVALQVSPEPLQKLPDRHGFEAGSLLGYQRVGDDDSAPAVPFATAADGHTATGDADAVVQLELRPASPVHWDRCQEVYGCQTQTGVYILGYELDGDTDWDAMRELQQRLDWGGGAVVKMLPGPDSRPDVALRVLARCRARMLSRGRDFVVVPMLPAHRAHVAKQSDSLAAVERQLMGVLVETSTAQAGRTTSEGRTGGAAEGRAGVGTRTGAAAAAAAEMEEVAAGRDGGGSRAGASAAAAAAVGRGEAVTEGGREEEEEEDLIPDLVKPDPGPPTRSHRRSNSGGSSSFSGLGALLGLNGGGGNSRNGGCKDSDDSSRDDDDAAAAAPASAAAAAAALPTANPAAAAARPVHRLTTHWRRRRAFVINQALCHWMGLIGSEYVHRCWILDPPAEDDVDLSGEHGTWDATKVDDAAAMIDALLNPRGAKKAIRQLVAERLVLVVLECRPGRPDLLVQQPQGGGGGR